MAFFHLETAGFLKLSFSHLFHAETRKEKRMLILREQYMILVRERRELAVSGYLLTLNTTNY